MSAKENARPDVGASERAGLDAEAWQATASVFNDTTAPPPGQSIKIADFLSPGQQNAVPLKHLKDLLHLDGRKIRLMIWGERLQGTPILADCVSGYYLPGDDRERAQCVRSMRRRAAEIVKAADAIEWAERIG